MTSLLFKLLVSKFYKVNAGFLLLLFIALFGVMSANETVWFHTSIMYAVTGSPVLFAGILLVFSLFHLRCLLFTLGELSHPTNSFLYNLQALNKPAQVWHFTYCQAAMAAPALLYGAATAWVGITSGHVAYALVILAAQPLLCFVGGLVYYHHINATVQQPWLKVPNLKLFPNTSFYAYLLKYSVQMQKGTFIGIKIFSLLMLQFLVSLNTDSVSRENICFVLLFIISGHALVPVHYVQFVEVELPFLRNMPMLLAKRFSVFLITYAVIFIPEILFLWWNELDHIGWYTLGALYLLFITRMSFFTSLQYVRAMTTDRYTLLVFGLFFCTLILLASVSLVPFIVVESIIAALLYRKLYYAYEPSERTNKP